MLPPCSSCSRYRQKGGTKSPVRARAAAYAFLTRACEISFPCMSARGRRIGGGRNGPCRRGSAGVGLFPSLTGISRFHILDPNSCCLSSCSTAPPSLLPPREALCSCLSPRTPVLRVYLDVAAAHTPESPTEPKLNIHSLGQVHRLELRTDPLRLKHGPGSRSHLLEAKQHSAYLDLLCDCGGKKDTQFPPPAPILSNSQRTAQDGVPAAPTAATAGAT